MPAQTVPLLIAHRGASAQAPENTLAAFQLGLEQEAQGIEGDFRLTSDGQIVCIHDESTRRTGSQNMLVEKSTLAELRQVDVGAWKGDVFQGEKIPTLEEVLGLLPADKLFFMEVKCGPEIVQPLKVILQDWPQVIDRLSVIAFNPRVILTMRSELPEVQANWLTEFKDENVDHVTNLKLSCGKADWHPTGKEVSKILTELHAGGVGVQANLDAVDEKFVAPLHAKEIGLHVWTVDDAKAAARFATLGFQSITTNRPQQLRAEMKALIS